MNIIDLTQYSTDKLRFQNLDGFLDLASNYLEFVSKHLQAVIVSQNEPKYRFFQYDSWGSYQITRPVNSELFCTKEEFDGNREAFLEALLNARNFSDANTAVRDLVNKTVYTAQQCIGATLDALPPGQSNKARKLNGDLFEQFVRLLFRGLGIPCESGVVRVPVVVDNTRLFDMSYQHDLIVTRDGELKMLGTIKTSSKDRLDKIFVDKFLYSRLTNTTIPHVAVILNDVQRKKSSRENEYGINSTFLPGHFKGYTIKLNPLDGVYYCDIRPNMRTDSILKEHIKTFDCLIFDDIWKLI